MEAIRAYYVPYQHTKQYTAFYAPLIITSQSHPLTRNTHYAYHVDMSIHYVVPECLHRGEFKCEGCGASVSVGCKKSPEPEVPENIKNLLLTEQSHKNIQPFKDQLNSLIIEAELQGFLRGQKAGSK
jgi:hypothetical protein